MKKKLFSLFIWWFKNFVYLCPSQNTNSYANTNSKQFYKVH